MMFCIRLRMAEEARISPRELAMALLARLKDVPMKGVFRAIGTSLELGEITNREMLAGELSVGNVYAACQPGKGGNLMTLEQLMDLRSFLEKNGVHYDCLFREQGGAFDISYYRHGYSELVTAEGTPGRTSYLNYAMEHAWNENSMNLVVSAINSMIPEDANVRPIECYFTGFFVVACGKCGNVNLNTRPSEIGHSYECSVCGSIIDIRYRNTEAVETSEGGQ